MSFKAESVDSFYALIGCLSDVYFANEVARMVYEAKSPCVQRFSYFTQGVLRGAARVILIAAG
jgi:hypothetical protein